MVKIRKHSQASSEERARRGWLRLRPKYGQRSGSGRLTWPDANVAPSVYRVDLTHPVMNAEHGKAAGLPPGRFQGKPTVRQAQGKRHGEDRISKGRSVTDRIDHVDRVFPGKRMGRTDVGGDANEGGSFGINW